MTFEQALVNLRAGRKVYRPGRHEYSGVKPVWLAYRQANGTLVWDYPGAMFPTPWLMPEDLEANDWEVYGDDKVCQCPIEDWRDVPMTKYCLVCGGKTGV